LKFPSPARILEAISRALAWEGVKPRVSSSIIQFASHFFLTIGKSLLFFVA